MCVEAEDPLHTVDATLEMPMGAGLHFLVSVKHLIAKAWGHHSQSMAVG